MVVIRNRVSDAEKYREEDEKVAQKITARNGLESYAYNLRNTLQDEKIAGKLDPDDKKKLEDAIQESITWLDNNQEAEKDEYEHKQKSLEEIANPIMMKLYGSGGAPGGGFPAGSAPGGFPDATDTAAGDDSGPTIEEVD
ncbi:11351_t:CDS:2 [Entrophospora sp. SA101]|nr:11351_t:CDS:2 [Entrophospora sp. SA101]